MSGRRPRRVREAPEERPGGVRGASGSCPKDIQIVFQGPSWQNRARALKQWRSRVELSDVFGQGCQITISCLTILWRCVFNGRRDGFPRLCTTTALVQKVENRRACAQELHRSLRKSAQNLSFEFESCVFAVPVQKTAMEFKPAPDQVRV